MWEWALASKRELIISAVLIGAAVVTTVVGRIVVARAARDVDLRQRLRRGVSYAGIALVTLGLLATWFAQIQQTVLALAAFAVAFVVASKELILCIVGGVYKAFVGPYEIGDRIEVAGLRGDVVDAGLLATTLMEVGPNEASQRSTGRVTVVPHSVLLANAVHTAGKWPYCWHELALGVAPGGPWRDVERTLRELATIEHRPIQQSLEKALADLQDRYAFRAPPAQPSVFVTIQPEGRVVLTLRWAVPIRQNRVSEDRILRGLLERFGPETFAKDAPKRPDPGAPTTSA